MVYSAGCLKGRNLVYSGKTMLSLLLCCFQSFLRRGHCFVLCHLCCCYLVFCEQDLKNCVKSHQNWQSTAGTIYNVKIMQKPLIKMKYRKKRSEVTKILLTKLKKEFGTFSSSTQVWSKNCRLTRGYSSRFRLIQLKKDSSDHWLFS